MQHSHIAYPPAEGERRAISGYYPQYRISASLILRSLREESLQWIRIADPKAGRVDDLQIGILKRMIHVERSFYDKGERLQRDMHAERILDR